MGVGPTLAGIGLMSALGVWPNVGWHWPNVGWHWPNVSSGGWPNVGWHWLNVSSGGWPKIGSEC